MEYKELSIQHCHHDRKNSHVVDNIVRVRESVSQQLRPKQLGFGTPGSAEPIVLAVRSHLSVKDRCILLKVDFAIAFNSNRRDTMLREVHKHAPALYRLTYQAYKEATLAADLASNNK